MAASDIIFIRDLEIETIIGIFAWERTTNQTVRLNLELGCDIRRAAGSDNIADAVDYKAISKRLIRAVEASEFFLVEALAEHLAGLLLSEFQLPWVRLTVSKPGALRGARDVGLTIERQRDQLPMA